jgi:hypothetical protein
MVVEAFLSPGFADDLQALVEALMALFEGDTVATELTRLVATSDAEVEPPIGELVQKRKLLGDPNGIVERENADARPDANALGASRRIGTKYLSRGHHPVVREVVLCEPDLVESDAVRVLDEFDIFLVVLSLRSVARGLEEMQKSETGHGEPQFSRARFIPRDEL